MSTRNLFLFAAAAALTLGCQGGGNGDQSGPAESTAAMPVAGASDAAVKDDEEIELVWADDAFLTDAGVKEGKDVIYLPTPPMVIDKMIEMAEIKKSDLVYDLGTGDGRIAIEVARRTGARTIGYEIDPDLVIQARENVRAAGLEDLVTIEEKDILTLDFRPANVVLMYLNPELNVRLIPQLSQLRDGSRIVSHDWGMQGKIVAEQVIEDFRSKVPDFVNSHTLYLWKTPFRTSD